MSLDLQSRIQIVVLMARLDSATAVRRQLQRENMSDIPSENAIRSLYAKFLKTGSVHDRARSGRPPSATAEKRDQIGEVLSTMSVTSVRAISQEVNMSKSVVRRTMRQMGYKPFKMHLTQQLFDEDKDLRVEMAESLLPILDNRDNDGVIFFSDEANFHVSGVVH
jgi:transposase